MATQGANVLQAQPFPLCFFDPESDVPEERVLFDGLLTASDLAVWIGREKHRKTNLLLHLAICASLARDFLTFRYRGGSPAKVVFFDYESKTGSLKHRYEAICNSLGLTDAEKELLHLNLHIVEVRKIRRSGFSFERFPRTERDTKQIEFWKRLLKGHPADLYLIDPMRCFHVGKENDSEIEVLLEQVRRLFGMAAVIISHHMRKQSNKRGETALSLSEPGIMREWSDGARGSGAIKAHADVIVCQERKMEGETEVVYLGAFMKDGADIEPMPLSECGEGSFLFQPSRRVPGNMRTSYEALNNHLQFPDRAAAAQVLQETGVHRSTAFRHVKRMLQLGLLVESEQGIGVST